MEFQYRAGDERSSGSPPPPTPSPPAAPSTSGSESAGEISYPARSRAILYVGWFVIQMFVRFQMPTAARTARQSARGMRPWCRGRHLRSHRRMWRRPTPPTSCGARRRRRGSGSGSCGRRRSTWVWSWRCGARSWRTFSASRGPRSGARRGDPRARRRGSSPATRRCRLPRMMRSAALPLFSCLITLSV